MNHILFQVMWMAGCMCITYMEKKWHRDALWEEGNPTEAVCCSGQHSVDTIFADQVHFFMPMIFPNGTDLFYQNYVPCYTVKIVHEWFEKLKKRSRC